jgi:PBP1b-binding outer membrane lipoprotein LpoB
MKLKIQLSMIVMLLIFSGCVEDDPAPKCTTKAITYQEFKDYQKSQKAKSSYNKQVKKSDTVWKVAK